MKKILKITGISLLLLLSAAFAAPFLFKDKIMATIKKSVNENLAAKVDFADVDISLFRHFPRLAVSLENLQVIGQDSFAKDTLVAAREIDLALDLMSILSGDEMRIIKVNLDQPRIHAIVDKSGKANWDIFTSTGESPAQEEPSSFKMKLKGYSITDGYIRYQDDSSNIHLEIAGLDHEGSGDFTSDLFTLKTTSAASTVSFSYENIPYLASAHINIDADIEVDNKTEKYSFNTKDIQVNNLKISSSGFFQFLNDSTYNMDIAFSSPSNDFKDILSLVPSVYKNDFNKIKTTGSAVLKGFVKGKYSATEIPSYDVLLQVINGFFHYADLPKPVKNINFLLHVNNPDGVMDHTVVNIPKAHLEMDNEPFDFRLLFKNPETDRYIDAAAKGKLDLLKLTQVLKVDNGTILTGLVTANVEAKGNLAVVTDNKQGPFTAKGQVDIRNLSFSSKDFPKPVKHTNVTILVENPDGIADHTVIDIPEGHTEIGTESIDFKLRLKNPVSDPFFDGQAKGQFNLANVAQFVELEQGTKIAGTLDADISFSGRKSMIDQEKYEQIKASGDVNISNLHYASKEYPDGVQVRQLSGNFTPEKVTINEVNGKFKSTNFQGSGSVNNVIGYALKDETLAGVFNFEADQINLNEIMGDADTTTTTEASSEPFLVPANIDFRLNAKAGNVKYDNIKLQNLSGALQVANETVKMNDVKAATLGGMMTVNGSYSTRLNKKKPDISLTYDVKNINIQEAFYAFNTFQKLMPVGQFISGKLSSELTLNGKLGETMTPELNTMNGKGLFLVVEGLLKNFKPLTQLSQTLNVSELNDISMKDISSNFEFANGKVLVKPFKVRMKDIEMEIGGMHGLDQSLDYIINLKVPRSKMGEKGNQYVNNLVTEAANKGVPVKVDEMVNFNVNMGGTVTHPLIKVNLKQAGASLAADMKKQAADFAKARVDSAKVVVKDTLQAIKKDLVNAAKNELLNKLQNKPDSAGNAAPVDTKKRLEEAGKGIINGFFKKKKTGTDTSAGR